MLKKDSNCLLLGPGSALPPANILMFLSWGLKNYSPSSLLVTCSAIKLWHLEQGLQNPFENLEVKSFEDHTRKLARARNGKSNKAPLPHSVLKSLLNWVNCFDGSEPSKIGFYRDAAMLILGFFGMMRKSELGKLKVSDV